MSPLALEAPSLDDVTDPVGRTFRAFADQTRSDRLALAACLRGSRGLMTTEEAARIAVPVLIAVGTDGRDRGLRARARRRSFRARKCSTFPNRDHMRAVGDKVYKTGVLDFLSRAEVRCRRAGSSSSPKMPDRRDQHREGRDPDQPRAVAVMRPRDHAADEGVAEQRQRDGRRQQRRDRRAGGARARARRSRTPAASSPARPEHAAG